MTQLCYLATNIDIPDTTIKPRYNIIIFFSLINYINHVIEYFKIKYEMILNLMPDKTNICGTVYLSYELLRLYKYK